MYQRLKILSENFIVLVDSVRMLNARDASLVYYKLLVKDESG